MAKFSLSVVLLPLAIAVVYTGINQLMVDGTLRHHLQSHLEALNPCPSGVIALQKPNWPGPNGCGSEWNQWQTQLSQLAPFIDQLTPCCNAHDYCSSRCGYPDFKSSFMACANKFKKCMRSKCDKMATSIANPVEKAVKRMGCRANADAFALLVRKGGKSSYNKSQKLYCLCQ